MRGCYPDSWRTPAIFDMLAEAASLDAAEMLQTFNMGVGFAVVLPAGRSGCGDGAARCGRDRLRDRRIVEGSGVVYE